MDDPAEVFQRRNRRFLIAANVVLAAIAAVIVLTLIVLLTRGPTMRVASIERLALSWAPAAFYLWALWTLRGLFAALARGGLNFQPLIAQRLVTHRLGARVRRGRVSVERLWRKP